MASKFTPESSVSRDAQPPGVWGINISHLIHGPLLHEEHFIPGILGSDIVDIHLTRMSYQLVCAVAWGSSVRGTEYAPRTVFSICLRSRGACRRLHGIPGSVRGNSLPASCRSGAPVARSYTCFRNTWSLLSMTASTAWVRCCFIIFIFTSERDKLFQRG